MDPVTLLLVCGFSQTAISQPCNDLPLPSVSLPNPLQPREIETSFRVRSRLDPWQNFVAEAAKRFLLPEDWIYAVMTAESGGRTMLDGFPITSRAGAMGLMQLVPATFEAMRLRYGLGSDPYDPHDNILAGAAYLKELLDRYGAPLFLAAYNAGPTRLDRFLNDGTALPLETERYVSTVGAVINFDDVAGGDGFNSSLPAPHISDEKPSQMVRSGPSFSTVSQTKVDANSSALFVPLGTYSTPKNPPAQSALFVSLAAEANR